MYEKELPQINALICIENEDFSETLYQYYSRSGASKTVCVQSKYHVASVVKETEFNFFLISQNLPDIDGIELYKSLMKYGRITREKPGVLLMDNPTQENVLRAREYGITNILVPPYTLHSISTRTKQALAIAAKPVIAKPKTIQMPAHISARATPALQQIMGKRRPAISERAAANMAHLSQVQQSRQQQRQMGR